jgi:hypothetical protein
MATQGTSDELPIAIAHQLAAIAAHTALRFIDTGASSLIGAQIHVNYLEPLTPKLSSFSRHPQCECVWRPAQSEFASEAMALDLADIHNTDLI